MLLSCRHCLCPAPAASYHRLVQSAPPLRASIPPPLEFSSHPMPMFGGDQGIGISITPHCPFACSRCGGIQALQLSSGLPCRDRLPTITAAAAVASLPTQSIAFSPTLAASAMHPNPGDGCSSLPIPGSPLLNDGTVDSQICCHPLVTTRSSKSLKIQHATFSMIPH